MHPSRKRSLEGTTRRAAAVKRDRYNERVFRNAIGWLSSAFRPLKGAHRPAARGFWSGMFAVLMSFFGRSPGAPRPKAAGGIKSKRSGRDGYHTYKTRDKRPPRVRYGAKA